MKLEQRAGYQGRWDNNPSALIAMDRWDTYPFSPELLRSLADEASRRNWQIVELEYFDGRMPEGLVFDGTFVAAVADSEHMRQIRPRAGKILHVATTADPWHPDYPAVMQDQKAWGAMAADHFASRGFRHIGFIGRDPWGLSLDLYLSMKTAAEAAAMDVHLLQLPMKGRADDAKRRRHQEMFRQWIREVPKPFALLCQSDYLAAKSCARIRMAGFRIPADVAILSCGNVESICTRSLPSLSSIDIAEFQRGAAACELMADLLAGKQPPPEPVMIPPSGITARESTDVLATVDPAVADALRFMWDNIARDISVDDVAEHVGLNRRKLERAFRRELDRGVNAELRRRRLEKSCELLRNTDLPVADVAHAVGFRAEDYFYRAFKRAFDTTPLQWRKAAVAGLE